MGNSVKSRLQHFKKKDDRPARGDHENAPSQISPAHTEIDQAIMSGPNRTRAPEADSNSAPPPTRGVPSRTIETAAAPTTTARSRT